MAEITWLDLFYSKLDREEREMIFRKGMEDAEDTPENELRKKLWDLRYEQRTRKDPENVDYFMRALVELSFLRTTASGWGRDKKIKKAKESIRSDWALDLMKEYGEVGEKVFYQEFCHLMRLYIFICKEDKSYNSILLGLGRMKKSSLIAKIANDIYNTAFAIPKEMGLEEDCALFAEAAKNVYFEKFPKPADRRLLEDLIAGRQAE